jgi:hypothetical protein
METDSRRAWNGAHTAYDEMFGEDDLDGSMGLPLAAEL